MNTLQYAYCRHFFKIILTYLLKKLEFKYLRIHFTISSLKWIWFLKNGHNAGALNRFVAVCQEQEIENNFDKNCC